jgi:hypothetical protein
MYKFSELESLAREGLKPYIENGKIKIKKNPRAGFVPVKELSLKEKLKTVDERTKEVKPK